MTNLEGRVILRRKAVDPPEGVRSDTETLVALAAALGRGHLFPTAEPREVFEELRRASAGGAADYAGISYERIEAEDGVLALPVRGPSRDAPDVRASVRHRRRAGALPRRHPPPRRQEPDRDYPMHLTTGRVVGHYQSGTQTRRVAELDAESPEPFVELHPQIARVFGIEEGALVTIASRRGQAVARARLSSAIRHDSLFMPFHWGAGGRANLLTNPALDPYSRMPELKTCAARIAPHTEPDPLDGGRP